MSPFCRPMKLRPIMMHVHFHGQIIGRVPDNWIEYGLFMRRNGEEIGNDTLHLVKLQ